MLEAIDLETTSLPKLEYNKTRITELSMVVVKRRHVLDTRPGAVPRVQNKFTMCFNPRRMIDPGSTETSGLCNDLLEYETDFNINVFNTINGFLQCFEKPVCLVAQNGHSFDFPILKNHFEKLNVCLPDDILCADSLHAFVDLFEAEKVINESGNITVSESGDTQDANKSSEATTSKDLTDNIPSEKIIQKEELQPELIKEQPDNQDVITKEFLEIAFNEDKDLDYQKHSKKQNEMTPQTNKKLTPKLCCKSKVSRRLFWGSNNKPKISYKLKDIYERVLQRPAVEAHRAENDCTMTMEISVCVAKRFVEWVDNNHMAFSDVKAMTPGIPLGLLVLTGVLWGCTNPFIRQGTKGLRDVTATTWLGQAWAEVTFLLSNWKYVLPWLINQAGSLSYLAAVQRAPLSVAVPTANSLAFVFTAITGAGVGVEEPLDSRSLAGIAMIMLGTALCCYGDSS